LKMEQTWAYVIAMCKLHPKHIHNEDMNHTIHSIPLLLPCDPMNNLQTIAVLPPQT
jgi:hypothetical protein